MIEIDNNPEITALIIGFQSNDLSELEDLCFTLGIKKDIIEKAFLKAVQTLPEKQRIVFNLKYFKEMKYEEISEIIGTSVGALKASYHHAVKKIEAYLEKVI